MNKFKYSEALEWGFKKWKGNDAVFFNEYGFQYFGLSLELKENISLEWTVIDNCIDIYKNNDLIKRNLSLDEVHLIIKLIGHGKNK
jgi:hypothetical protein